MRQMCSKLVSIVIFGALLSFGTVQATTLTVPTQYSTIQAAVTAAGANDTVQVLPGTYTEAVTIPNTKPGLTLRGGNGVKVIGGFSVLTFNVSFEGFHISQGCTVVGFVYPVGIAISSSASNTIVRSNFFENIYGRAWESVIKKLLLLL